MDIQTKSIKIKLQTHKGEICIISHELHKLTWFVLQKLIDQGEFTTLSSELHDLYLTTFTNPSRNIP